MPDRSEPIRVQAVLRRTHQLYESKQGTQSRGMKRGFLRRTGSVVLRKAHWLGSGIFRVIKGRRQLKSEGPGFKQFRL